MPSFDYTGRGRDGQVVRGREEAADARAVASKLGGQGITPLTVTAAAGDADVDLKRIAAWFNGLTGNRISHQELQLFCRQMATLLKSGVPILRALEGLRQSSNNEDFAAVIADVRDGLQAGRELSVSLARHSKVFNQFFCNMIQIGEVTGQLDEMFLRLYQHLEFERDMAERVKTALRYPTFVVSAMGGALVVINIFVVPAFSKIFAAFHAELPLVTRLLIGFSNFTVNYGWLLGLLAFGGFYGFKTWVAKGAGQLWWDRMKLRLPIAGSIATKATLARFCRSFALAIRSGVPITAGLASVALAVDNAYMRQVIEKMKTGIERGDSVLKNAITAKVFTPVVIQMFAVGEETGDLDGMMEEVAMIYQREVDSELKTLSARIEPILIVGLGAMVLVLALGVFLPMWDLSTVSQGK